MIRTRKAAQAWVEREGVQVAVVPVGAPITIRHPSYPDIVATEWTYLAAVNALITAIDDARASDARARESEIPW